MIAELGTLVSDRLKASSAQIADFCQRWQIAEFALFGSILRDNFSPDSDIDVLVTFTSGHCLSWDDWMKMQGELEAMFERKVDLVSKST